MKEWGWAWGNDLGGVTPIMADGLIVLLIILRATMTHIHHGNGCISSFVTVSALEWPISTPPATLRSWHRRCIIPITLTDTRRRNITTCRTNSAPLDETETRRGETKGFAAGRDARGKAGGVTRGTGGWDGQDQTESPEHEGLAETPDRSNRGRCVGVREARVGVTMWAGHFALVCFLRSALRAVMHAVHLDNSRLVRTR